MPMTMAIGGLPNHSLGYHLPPAYCRYPHFEARISANVTLVNNTVVLIPFVSTVNAGGYFNDATHLWVPPAGLIRLTLYALEHGARNTSDQFVLFTKNGADIGIADNASGFTLVYRDSRWCVIEIETNGSDAWGGAAYRWNSYMYIEQYYTVFSGTMLNWIPS